MANLNPDQIKNLIILQRSIIHQYALEDFTVQQLEQMQKIIERTKKEVLKYIRKKGKKISKWGDAQAKKILSELDRLTLGTRGQIEKRISKTAVSAGQMSQKEYKSILSFDRTVKGFNHAALSASQLRSLIIDTPVGGHSLQNWVNRAFTYTLQTQIKREIISGALKGEGIPKLVKRISQGFDTLSKREIVTLTRTYVQSAHVTAMKNVYMQNTDVVKGVEWSATLESGFSSTGQGTCERCAVLDGERYLIDEHPPCPLHPRCRCFLLPVTVSYKELGIPIEEIEDKARQYKIYAKGENIGAGTGRRSLIERGIFHGDYATFFEQQTASFKRNLLGPVRAELLAKGDLRFKDLVDRKTGNLLPIKTLNKRIDRGFYKKGKGGGSGGNTPQTPPNAPPLTKNVKETPEKPNERLQRALDDLERKIKNLEREKLNIINEDGDLVFEKFGGKSSVSYTVEEAKLFKDNILTHNHPNGTSFSAADIGTLINHDVKEVRAIGNINKYDGVEYKYSMIFKRDKVDKIFGDKQAFMVELDQFYVFEEGRVYKEFNSKINSGEITVDYANVYHAHNIWSRLVNYPRLTQVLEYKRFTW